MRKVVCVKVLRVTPRKPNSAMRSVAKVRLGVGKFVFAFVPGVGHNLQNHSVVFVRGGGARDLPGVHYTAISGLGGLLPVIGRRSSRSKYGSSK